MRIEHGDMRDVLARLIADKTPVHAVITDPPYHLVQNSRRGSNQPGDLTSPHGRSGPSNARGFMGKTWDGGDIAFQSGTWRLCFDLLPPGGHLIAFSGTRTYHRMAVAIEEAGFEIRDMISYLYGSGFPKSHNASKKIDRCRCEPSAEHLVRAVPDADVSQAAPTEVRQGALLQQGMPEQGASAASLQRATAADRSTQLGMEGRRDLPQEARQLREREVCPLPAGTVEHGEGGRLRDGASAGNGSLGWPAADAHGDGASHGSRATEQRADQSGTMAGQPEPQAGGAWPVCGGCGKPIIPDGLGTALKPACEPICLARKPLSGTVVETVLKHGTGALNIDATRIGIDETEREEIDSRSGAGFGTGNTVGGNQGRAEGKFKSHAEGRWPANVIHDGSDEVVSAFPEANSARASGNPNNPHRGLHHEATSYGQGDGKETHDYRDLGSAARFFYSAKADAGDRLGSKHPTVKPVDLMRWLVRLITPPGGTVLDPFAGSGTTGMACMAEGIDCILVEREAEYVADIKARLAHVRGDDTPLFRAAD